MKYREQRWLYCSAEIQLEYLADSLALLTLISYAWFRVFSLPRGGGYNLFYLGRLQLYLLLKPNQTSKYKKESSLPKT